MSDWIPERLNRLREDARMMRIYHDDHGIAEVIALCDAYEELQAKNWRLQQRLIKKSNRLKEATR